MRISDWSSDVCSSDLQPSEHFRADVSAVLPQFCQHPGHLLHVVQDDDVGYQLVVTHDLALLVLDVIGDDAFAAEARPFDEAVKLIALVCGVMTGFANFDVLASTKQCKRCKPLAQVPKAPK